MSSSEKMYFTTESPCFEPSYSPVRRIDDSLSPHSASISYQYDAELQSLSMVYARRV